MRSRTGHWMSVAVATAVIAGLLTACGGVSDQRVGDDDLRFLVHGRTVLPTGGMDALVGGALAAADGCVLLEAGDIQYPVVWPSGTSVAGTDPLVIELPSGEQVQLGDEIEGGGGYLDAGRLGIDVPNECLNEYGEVAVFNADADPVATAS